MISILERKSILADRLATDKLDTAYCCGIVGCRKPKPHATMGIKSWIKDLDSSSKLSILRLDECRMTDIYFWCS